MALGRVKELSGKVITTLKDEGIKSLTKKSYKYVSYKVGRINRKYDKCFKDVLFINGLKIR